MANHNDDFRVDIMITAGELDESGHRYLDNDMRVVEVVKHNVPYSEFREWCGSAEWKARIQELQRIGEDRFGQDHWLKYDISYFCTTPHKD